MKLGQSPILERKMLNQTPNPKAGEQRQYNTLISLDVKEYSEEMLV